MRSTMRQLAICLFTALATTPAAYASKVDKILGVAAPSPLPIAAELDASRAVTKRITAAGGGELTATASDGTVYKLSFPANAVLKDTTVTLTPLARTRTKTGSGEGIGFDLQPLGTPLFNLAKMRVTLGPNSPLRNRAVQFLATKGPRSAENAEIGLRLRQDFGMSVAHFSGGVVMVGKFEYPRVTLVPVGWMPFDGEQGGAASEADRYRQAAERMKNELRNGVEPGDFADSLIAWKYSAMDAYNHPAGDETPLRAEYNREVVAKLEKAFDEAIADRLEAALKAIKEHQKKLDKAAEAGAKEAARLAAGGALEDIGKIADALAAILRAERHCQLLGLCEARTLEHIADIIAIFDTNLNFKCNDLVTDGPKIVPKLLGFGRTVQLLGAETPLNNWEKRFNNLARACQKALWPESLSGTITVRSSATASGSTKDAGDTVFLDKTFTYSENKSDWNAQSTVEWVFKVTRSVRTGSEAKPAGYTLFGEVTQSGNGSCQAKHIWGGSCKKNTRGLDWFQRSDFDSAMKVGDYPKERVFGVDISGVGADRQYAMVLNFPLGDHIVQGLETETLSGNACPGGKPQTGTKTRTINMSVHPTQGVGIKLEGDMEPSGAIRKSYTFEGNDSFGVTYACGSRGPGQAEENVTSKVSVEIDLR